MKNTASKLSTVSLAILGLAIMALPAQAWEEWEKPFNPAKDIVLHDMGQDEANSYCRGRYNDLRNTGDINPGFQHVNHVWAHLDANKCVYNVTKFW